jgi:hypothetical protein
MCPHCRQNAPVVYRGIVACCTACGAVRPPLAGTSVNLAGQPSKVGGQVARVLGWLVLGVGGTIGMVLLGLFQWLLPEGILGYVIGSPVMIASLALGLFLLRSGRRLRQSGESTERATQEQAVFALSANRGGVVSAYDVSTALGMPLERADALLTSMAKEKPDWVTLEVDDASGAMYYRVASPEARRRVRDEGLRARIDAAVARSPSEARDRLPRRRREEPDENDRAPGRRREEAEREPPQPTRVVAEGQGEAAEIHDAEVRAQAGHQA